MVRSHRVARDPLTARRARSDQRSSHHHPSHDVTKATSIIRRAGTATTGATPNVATRIVSRGYDGTGAAFDVHMSSKIEVTTTELTSVVGGARGSTDEPVVNPCLFRSLGDASVRELLYATDHCPGFKLPTEQEQREYKRR